jgi:acetyl-CoA acetyltransferase
MSVEDREIVVRGDARTPFGTFMGSLRNVSAIELGAVAARGALVSACSLGSHMVLAPLPDR